MSFPRCQEILPTLWGHRSRPQALSRKCDVYVYPFTGQCVRRCPTLLRQFGLPSMPAFQGDEHAETTSLTGSLSAPVLKDDQGNFIGPSCQNRLAVDKEHASSPFKHAKPARERAHFRTQTTRCGNRRHHSTGTHTRSPAGKAQAPERTSTPARRPWRHASKQTTPPLGKPGQTASLPEIQSLAGRHRRGSPQAASTVAFFARSFDSPSGTSPQPRPLWTCAGRPLLVPSTEEGHDQTLDDSSGPTPGRQAADAPPVAFGHGNER